MRGHEPLISMRLRGCKPRSCALSLFPVKSWATDWHKHPSTEGDATIEISEEEAAMAGRLDLRFLVDLNYVTVSGPDNDLTTQVAMAALDAGAKKVTAVYFDLTQTSLEQLVRAQDFIKAQHGIGDNA